MVRHTIESLLVLPSRLFNMVFGTPTYTRPTRIASPGKDDSFSDPNSLDDPNKHRFHFMTSYHLMAEGSIKKQPKLLRHSHGSRRTLQQAHNARRSRISSAAPTVTTVSEDVETAADIPAAVFPSAWAAATGAPAAAATASAPAAAAAASAPAEAPAADAPSKAPVLGWRGSEYNELVDGVHEHREAIAKRKKLRLLPDINNLVMQL